MKNYLLVVVITTNLVIQTVELNNIRFLLEILEQHIQHNVVKLVNLVKLVKPEKQIL